MTAYVKDIKTFNTIAHFDVEIYSVYTETSTNKPGNIVIPKELPDYTGNWLFFNGLLWIISQSKPKDDKTTLIVLPPIAVFDRDIIYSDSDAQITVGAFIAAKITSEFINQPDDVYEMPYLSVANTDTTPFVAPALDKGNVFNFAEYINTARRTGTDISFVVNSDGVDIFIYTKNTTAKAVLFNDGHSFLSNVVFTRDACAKLTVQKETEVEGEYETSVFYLSADGEISTDIPAERAVGSWQITYCGKDKDAEEAAQEHFAKNSYTHKIEFYSDRRFGLYDSVRLALPTGLFNTQINEIQVKSSDSRYLYSCGDLPTTLTEQVAKNKEKTK